MTLKPVATCGQWKETSFIVITSNLEFMFMCRKKNHCNPVEEDGRVQDYAHKSGCVARKRTNDDWNVEWVFREATHKDSNNYQTRLLVA